MNKINFFQLAKIYALSLIIFLFPLFFLPITQEYFITNKMYLLAFGSLLLLAVSTMEFLVTKKIRWETKPLDTPVIVFVLSMIVSVILSSPNKIQAVLNPGLGLVSFISLAILYFYISREKSLNLLHIFASVSAAIMAIITIIFFFQPFKNINLPPYWQFLKSPSFTPMGTQLDLVIFLAAFAIMGLVALISISKKRAALQLKIIVNVYFVILSLAFLLTLYALVKSVLNVTMTNTQNVIFPPLNVSWYSAVEILKNPINAFFGAGPDNFASLFTRLKDSAYNQSKLWQINSFSFSRSGILQIMSEMGLFGIVAFGMIIGTAAKIINNNKQKLLEEISRLKTVLFLGFTFFMMVLFPVSLPLLFLFFVGLALLTQFQHATNTQELDLVGLLPVYLGLLVLSVVLIGSSTFLLGFKAYAAEFYFKKSLDGIVTNDLKTLYDNQRQAVLTNPFIERFRINFSQANLLIANNIASKIQTNSSNESNKTNSSSQLSDQDRQTIAQAIQAAIAEAKAAVALNPQKSANWENLAVIYRNILNVAQGADAWTISAYQRAIMIDPQNPIYRLNLGGVYYSLNNWDDAINMFSQTVNLKPDWSNAYYNLAWASYQKGSYQQAVNAMQSAISLLDPKQSPVDFERAQKELEQFKAKLPKTETQPATSGTKVNKPNELSLPTPAPSISPRIQLPKTASPEAR